MINLLPFEQQKLVRADYWHRVYIVIFFFVAGALATLLLFLGLIYFTFLQTSATASLQGGVETGLSKEELEKELKLASTALNVFSTKDDDYVPTALLTELITGSPAPFGVYLTGFSYKVVKKDETVLFSGSAKTRDSLVRFLDHLRSRSIVASVESPIGSLSKSADIPFSVTIHLKPYAGKK
jgi:hypothetical protein